MVSYFQKHRPRESRFLTGLLSPLLAHCKLLREQYGPEIGIVFIGPCIAKKLEAMQHPELLDAALTFEDLRRWWEQEKISPEGFPESAGDQFIPERAAGGGVVPGGRGNDRGDEIDLRGERLLVHGVLGDTCD